MSCPINNAKKRAVGLLSSEGPDGSCRLIVTQRVDGDCASSRSKHKTNIDFVFSLRLCVFA